MRKLHEELRILRESRKVVRTRLVSGGAGVSPQREILQELVEGAPLVV